MSVRLVLKYLWQGLFVSKFPVCCVFAFISDSLSGKEPGRERAGYDGYVPCQSCVKFGGRHDFLYKNYILK